MLRPALAAALLLALPLAGCVDEGAPPADLVPSNETGEANETAPVPEGREEISAFKETNKTEEGIGGLSHTHDYWKGRDRVVLYERVRSVNPFPVYDENDQVHSETLVGLPSPNLVYEGAVQVEVLVKEPFLRSVQGTPVPHPSPPTLNLLYLTAADGANQWRDGGPLAYGTPTVIEVLPEETDMPHSLASLWLFRLVTPGSHTVNVNVTITAVRGEDVPEWPGHPDFYADDPTRVVHTGQGETRERGLGASLFYPYGYDYVFPDRLISWGTTELDVFVNVTRVKDPAGGTQEPIYYYLRVRNATAFDTNDDTYEAVVDPNDPHNLRFEVPVDPQGMDSPYQPLSRWGFALGAFYMAFSDSVPYELDYTVTIVASGESGEAPPAE